MTPISQIREQFPQYSDIPDGDLVRGLHRKFYADIPYNDFLKNIDFRKPVDPTEGMSGPKKFLAGAGKAFLDIGKGVGQMVGAVDQKTIDETKELDKPLMSTGSGIAGNIIGNAAIMAPTAMLPGANTYGGAALIGSAGGAIQPTATGESRTANAGVGAAAGFTGQALGNALGRLAKPVASRISPEEQALANAATREGIPLTAGQATGSKPLQTVESVLENLPLTSGRQLAGREAQQRAFTAAALKRAGVNADVADAGTLLTQKNALGSQIEGVAKNNTLDFNQGLTNKLADIVDNASKRLPLAEAQKISGTVDQILSQVEQSGQMLGTNYQGWREPLRGLASEGGASGTAYREIRKALDDAFRSQLKGPDADTVTQASRQYANVKTIIDAMGGAGNLPAKGQIAPAQLGAALSRSVGREGKALGRGDLNELSKVGQLFVRDQIPNSGTAQRQFVQNLMTTVPGAGIGYMAGGPEGAATGAALGAALTYGGPKAVQSLMNSKAGQAYLSRGAVPITEAQRRALSNALRTVSVGATPVLSSSE